MKKNIFKIVIAAVVLLLLIGGTILLKMPAKTNNSSPEETPTAAPTYTIYSEEADNVKSVLVTSGEFSMEGEKLEDGTWTVNNLPDADIDKSKAKTFAETAISMNAASMVEENPSDLAQYGLDAPDTTVTINKNDGTSDKIFIGGKSPVNNNYFVMTSLESTVYTLSFYKLDTLKNPLTYYTEFTRFSMEDTSEISGVKIERSDMTINIVRQDDDSQSLYSSWKMTSPIETAANSDYISNTVLDSIGKIKLSSPITDGDFGISNSSAKLTLTIKPYNDETEEYEEEYTEQFTIGKLSEGNVYVQYKDKVYTVSASNLEFVNTPLLNMVMKIQSLVNISGVEKVEMNYRGAAHSLDITHSGEDDSEMTFKLDGKDIDESNAKKLYQEVIGIQIDGIYEGQPVGETVMSVYFKGYNGTADVNVEFKTINDLDCAFVKDGQIQFTVKKSVVEELMNKADSYMN